MFPKLCHGHYIIVEVIKKIISYTKLRNDRMQCFPSWFLKPHSSVAKAFYMSTSTQTHIHTSNWNKIVWTSTHPCCMWCPLRFSIIWILFIMDHDLQWSNMILLGMYSQYDRMIFNKPFKRFISFFLAILFINLFLNVCTYWVLTVRQMQF